MRTYNDLSDDQLKQLASLAADDEDIVFEIGCDDPDFITACTRHAQVYFWLEDGDIITDWNGKTTHTHNIWQIVALCKSWGLTYSTGLP